MYASAGTDKTREVDPVTECSYVNKLAAMSNNARGLDIFVATDDQQVIDGVNACRATRALNWHVHHFNGNPGRGTGREIIYRLYAEITVMTRADWVVGTFSSNVGRIVQLLRELPEETMSSLDSACILSHQYCDNSRPFLWHPGRI